MNKYNNTLTQLAAAVKYTDCISFKGQRTPMNVLIYDTKGLDSETLVLELWRMWYRLSLPILPGPH